MRTQVNNVQIKNHSLTGADIVEGVGIFDETISYLVGEKVIWKSTLYKCIIPTTGKTEGDLSSTPDKDIQHWDEIKIDGEAHRILDQLVHDISENCHTEIIRTSGKVSNVIIWTNSLKTTKIREFTITRENNKVQSVVSRQYTIDGLLIETYTQTISRTSGKVTSIDGVKP